LDDYLGAKNTTFDTGIFGKAPITPTQSFGNILKGAGKTG